MPRLPRKTTVDVSLCHACHAKCRGVTGAQTRPSPPPSTMSATAATQNDGGCEFVARLPHKRNVDVSLCHACHANCRGVTGAQTRPSAPPSAICTTPATQNDGRCEIVPMSVCATQNNSISRCEFVPRLPRKVPRHHGRPNQTMRATQCHLYHACHAKRR